MRYFTDSPFERLMMEVPHGHSLAAEAAWRHEQQATGKPAAFSLTSKSERSQARSYGLHPGQKQLCRDRRRSRASRWRLPPSSAQTNEKTVISKETVIWFPGASVIWFRWRSLKTMTFGWRVGGARICRFCPIRGSTFPMKRRKSSLICFAA